MLKRIAPIILLMFGPSLLAEPVAPFSADRAIEDLADPEFKNRNAAQEQLLAWGRKNVESGIERFYEAYRRHEDPEVRARSRDLLKTLVAGRLSRDGEGYIGIMMREDDVPGQGGGFRKAIRITTVMENTPAEKAKLQVGDLVMGIDELELALEGSINTFGNYVRTKKPGNKVTLHVQRNDKALDVVVELMKRPPIPQPQLQFLGEGLIIPSEEETEEQEFREWLEDRLAEEKAQR